MGERSLVLFTLLAQTACGALVGLAGMQVLGDIDVLGPLSFSAVGAVLLVAVIISTLHLGQPRHAPYAMLNLRRSWLSREILGVSLTGGLVALGAFVGLLAEPATSYDTRTLMGVLAAVAGLFLVATMVGLYSVRTITEWRPLTTALCFVGSTLPTGSHGRMRASGGSRLARRGRGVGEPVAHPDASRWHRPAGGPAPPARARRDAVHGRTAGTPASGSTHRWSGLEEAGRWSPRRRSRSHLPLHRLAPGHPGALGRQRGDGRDARAAFARAVLRAGAYTGSTAPPAGGALARHGRSATAGRCPRGRPGAVDTAHLVEG